MLAEEIRNNAACGRREPGEDILVIGADTVVAFEGEILGKPHSESDAGVMLNKLSGNIHQVYTGVALIYYPGSQESPAVECKSFYEKTDVTFCKMESGEVDEYVKTGDCMDKAGAYGIQGFCARYIKGISGDYNNVVGLPVGRLYQEMKEWL
jgi:septum formation protein